MGTHNLTTQWLRRLEEAKARTSLDHPGYWHHNPQSLTSSSTIERLAFGTGETVYTNVVLPILDTAESEIILVTCFWARSATLDALCERLRKLSTKAVDRGDRIRIRICFSSSSLFQKLFHTTSLSGRTYLESEWASKLGLPRPEDLRGLDLEVKSIFVLPFSVMHPKFIIVDRSRVVLPSCNVSWENWFEGCATMTGPVVEHFVTFWKSFWASDEDRSTTVKTGQPQRPLQPNTEDLLHSYALDMEAIPTIFLPSPHHRNPHFTPPWQPCTQPPSTPLNTFLLTAFDQAQKFILIQTPNLTAPPVLSALLSALKRGITIDILTSESLMVLEQLITSGTTTRRCVRKLLRRHARLMRDWRDDSSAPALESGHVKRPGNLRIRYFRPEQSAASSSLSSSTEPVQSHHKLMVIDDEVTVLGSGNMDRASWFTSQELGVAVFSREFAERVRQGLGVLMGKRAESVGTSGG